MNGLISSGKKCLSWAVLSFVIAVGAFLWLIYNMDNASSQKLTDGELMIRLLVLPTLLAVAVLALTTACATKPNTTAGNALPALSVKPTSPFAAQVVGVQWLNPLQRRDYPTEWQLLWTLGLVQSNKDDDMVRTNPKKYTTLQAIAGIANGNNGSETFEGFHHKYVNKLTVLFHDIYFSNSKYFYNAHSRTDKKTWRELAGIRVEYALPVDRLDPLTAAETTRDTLIKTFSIGNVHMPTTWSRSTPPDVRVTMGGPNAGFTSLSAGLDYLQAHPNETVWVMNWDAPNFPPKDEQINENMVLLVLAGPNYNTERAALAWLSYPARKKVADFDAQQGKPSRAVQAWQATLSTAAINAGKTTTDIGFVIHDANNTHAASSDRLANLAHTFTTELVEFDFAKQTFNTPALLGEMGAGTALTNVALGIAMANHMGKHVLVAGTTDADETTAVLVTPPAKVRPLNPDAPWFRARGENNAYLPWWGLRHDATPGSQGYSK
ncbi:virulence factor [Massilia sp. CCM 8733]|uniref:Virulence factor n=1 Tax=Massilia mucilaginosa TaxID=2609282 RepID=A0ABX0NQ51_9BURK|nr:virulence factor [Massilia mucilaginosa]NHZ88894.1 virulence factor [Massilia mucilaginosa]